MAITTMSARGQVVIPAELRHELGLKRGVRFQVSGQQGEVMLKVIPGGDWRRLRGVLAGDPATAWLEEERRQDREREG